DAIDMTTGTPTLALHHVSVDHATAEGISAQAGTLIVDRSSIFANAAGGIDLHAAFDIQNTFITQNGGAGSAFGGMQIVAAGSTHRLEFTTIANNGGNSSVFNGVACTRFASAVTFSNNIIYGNINDQQVNGS